MCYVIIITVCVKYHFSKFKSVTPQNHAIPHHAIDTLGTKRMREQERQEAIIINMAKLYAASVKKCTAKTRLSGAPMPTRITTMYMAMLTKRESLM